MNAVLIPVRSTAGAKNRLATELDQSARTRLTLAMLGDMVRATRAAQRTDAVYVVSADHELLEQARQLGAHTLVEGAHVQVADSQSSSAASLGAAGVVGAAAADRVGGGLNRAVFSAATLLAERGVSRLLTIPGDVPLIGSAEVDAAFVLAASTPVVLIPSAAGSGTNGLLTSPPAVIRPRFEGESLGAHVRACEAAGLEYTIRVLSGFGLDIDTIEDLRLLSTCDEDRESVRVAAGLLGVARAGARALAG